MPGHPESRSMSIENIGLSIAVLSGEGTWASVANGTQWHTITSYLIDSTGPGDQISHL